KGQFYDISSLLSPEIDWHGLADEDGLVPCCRGRGEALERMRVGLLAGGQVSVSAFLEEGDRLLAHVHPAGDTPELPERFVVAEVHDELITHLHGYATETEARAALHAGPHTSAPAAVNADRATSPTEHAQVTTDKPVVTLRPLSRADLHVLVPWFEDPDTQRFVGGPAWPEAMLAHAERSTGTSFRGATQIGAHHNLALADGTPVGYIDCGTFDRLTVYAGEGPEGPIITETTQAVTGSIAFVINPARRRQGLATAAIRALTSHPDLAQVEVFEAGVDPDNRGARGALQAAGFRPRCTEPDDEGMLYYLTWNTEPRAPSPPA
ncbi:MAG: GNAT family N-acetyltransferase, partial [Trebonia sp.]